MRTGREWPVRNTTKPLPRKAPPDGSNALNQARGEAPKSNAQLRRRRIERLAARKSAPSKAARCARRERMLTDDRAILADVLSLSDTWQCLPPPEGLIQAVWLRVTISRHLRSGYQH